jgi:dienelactone hydrolase
MKTLATIAILLIVGGCLSLSLPFGTQGQNRGPQKRAPRNANGSGADPNPRPSPIPKSNPTSCPGLRSCTAAENNTPSQIVVEFPGPDNMTLHGHLYAPGVSSKAQLDALSKTFPVMIYNHGSEKHPDGVPALARLYVDHGFVFFAPDRHGQGLSEDAGAYIVDLQKQFAGTQFAGEESIILHELYNKDVIAAVNWLKKQRYVDAQRIAMTGVSYGGIQTLLTAEKDPGIRAYVPFAPGAMSWASKILQQRLITAVRKEKAPMFIIQAEGDYSTGPVTTLGAVLLEKFNPTKWKSKLYPQFGCTNSEAHVRFSTKCDGIVVWDQDVVAFLNEWVK